MIKRLWNFIKKWADVYWNDDSERLAEYIDPRPAYPVIPNDVIRARRRLAELEREIIKAREQKKKRRHFEEEAVALRTELMECGF